MSKLGINVAIALCAIAVQAMAQGGAKQSGDALMGTWKLNLAKSKYAPGAAPESSVVTREELPNGFKSTTHTVYGPGKITHYDYTAYYDGKDYLVVGDPARDQVSMKRVSERIVDTVSKKAGKVSSNTRLEVAPDGKTMTTTIRTTDAAGKEQVRVQYYDKQ
ncbi:MAG: hypothetical protein EXQ56_10075 [Acidobacteria bacterium]|nr:hypothetical protein [Acidobacteriota bacterium]